MARNITITSKPEQTNAILQDVGAVKDLLELQVYRGASVSPPGDVIELAVPNSSLNHVMRLLDNYDLGREQGLSISTSEVASYIPSGCARVIERDDNAATLEEMVMTISDDSNSSAMTLVIMFIAGVLAAVGFATNSVHLVIAGMLMAPGFMPITRMALGAIGRHTTWRYGAVDFCCNYGMLALGAAVTTLILGLAGYEPLQPPQSYYSTSKDLVNYWTGISFASIVSSAAASVAGVLLIATKRSVFSSGVMIGLALIPASAIIGMSLIEGNFQLTLKALLRFALDVGLVLVLGMLALVCVRAYFHKRNMRL